jgi:DNA-binding LacI/PurR family transcriptional regulator
MDRGVTMRETPTSAQVARLAGVSQSAVSRVFTPGASVSKPMRERVEAAASALGYRPNALARSLITGRSRIIGVIAGYFDNQWYPHAMEALSNALQARGYHALMFMASQHAQDVDRIVGEILDYQVDGILAASVSLSSDLAQRCAEAGVPVVLFNRAQAGEGFSTVTSDNFAGGREIARFLAAGGHRRIAYIAGWEGASTQVEREAGFRRGLAEAGLALAARETGDYESATAAAAARRLFSRRERPDAVFVANDHMALAVMDVLRFELGLDAPRDVSVVGYDDAPPAAWPTYALTTLRQPVRRMVAAAVEALTARIEHDDREPRRLAISGPLVVRRSARVPEGGWR